jgi:hypothetical protein
MVLIWVGKIPVHDLNRKMVLIWVGKIPIHDLNRKMQHMEKISVLYTVIL